MTFIGLHGFQRSGKDTTGDYLRDTYGFTQIAFAEPLKAGLLALDPYIVPKATGGTPRLLSSLVEEYGWEGIKGNEIWKDDVRRLQQRFGTECARETFWDSFWIDLAHRRTEGKKRVVFTDVRFHNEADYVRRHHGILINVVRPGFGPKEVHDSEQSLDCEIELVNDGTLDDLYRKIDEVFAGLVDYERESA